MAHPPVLAAVGHVMISKAFDVSWSVIFSLVLRRVFQLSLRTNRPSSATFQPCAAVLKLVCACSCLWLVFIIQGVAALVFTGYAVTKPVAKREHFCMPCGLAADSAAVCCLALVGTGRAMQGLLTLRCLADVTTAVVLTAMISYYAMVCPALFSPLCD